MILDPESLELVNAIEAMLDDPAPVGEVKPELMESVLEISTDPCAGIPQARDQLAERCGSRWPTSLRPRTWPSARRGPTRSRCGRTSGSWPALATGT